MSGSQPPTTTQLESAKRNLEAQEKVVDELTTKIEAAQRALDEFIAESKRAMGTLEEERQKANGEIQLIREFLSPMRRLPDDVLQQIFWCHFEIFPCCAWVLAAVCPSWRRIVLNMPRMWSKICLVTTPNSTPDTIRLWLERSGSRVPLDIELYLHVPMPPRKRRRAATPMWSPPPHEGMLFPPPPSPPYVPHHPPVAVTPVQLGMHNTIPTLPQGVATTSGQPYIVEVPTTSARAARIKAQSRTGTSWGHIALFYLTEQMHRWRRFVFRFDRQFDSMAAMRGISRDAPLLEEFEVSSAESLRSDPEMFAHDWSWLPSAESNLDSSLQNLKSVTLQFVPFKWTSPLLTANLRSINIRSLSNPHLNSHTSSQVTLDRLLGIIAANPALEHVALHFQNTQPAVLPLEPTRLPNLRSLSLGGSYMLTPLLDALITPSLDSLTLNIEREALDESIAALIGRSASPPISFLSISYQSLPGMGAYYPGDAPGIPPWSFLGGLPLVTTLQVGHTGLDLLMDALSHVDEDAGAWFAPQLEHLALKNCHGHGDGLPKLVALIEARNPALPGTATNANAFGVAMAGMGVPAPAPPFPLVPVGGAGLPSRLKTLELHDCTTMGEDILSWLQSRVANVKFSEPTTARYGGVHCSDDLYD